MEIDPKMESFISENLNSDPNELLLKYHNNSEIDILFAINQINGRKKIKSKIPSWFQTKGIIYPAKISIEQCSSELTGKYKASIIDGESLADLTGGFGVDTFFFSKKASVDYYEQNAELFDVVKYNLQQLNVGNVTMECGDGIGILANSNKKFDWIYLDPSRRNPDKGKVFLLSDCAPNIEEHLSFLLSRCKQLLIKLSPMMDINAIKNSLPNVQRFHVVAVKNECKELLVEVGEISYKNELVSVNLFENRPMEVQECSYSLLTESSPNIEYPMNYIYEPNKAILKAGIQNSLIKGFSIFKLNRHSNFFTSNELYLDFPGRVFKFHKTLKPRKKIIHQEIPNKKANIIARNFPMDASKVYSNFKIKPGGDKYLLATTLKKDEKLLLLCERLR